MLDVTKTAEAETALRAAYSDADQYANIVPVQGRYSMDDLIELFYQTLWAFDALDSGVHVNGASLERRENRYWFIVEGDLEDAWGLIDGLGIPREAVSLTTGEGRGWDWGG